MKKNRPKGLRFKDLAGRKFGKLFVIDIFGKNKRGYYWKCICDCGKKAVVRGTSLSNGLTKSCGCLVGKKIKHGHMIGHKATKTYSTWGGMITRCSTPSSSNFRSYGAKGIKVCDRWKDFRNFLKDMGEKPIGMSLDRKNPYGNYEPSNCRWVDAKTQRRNQLGQLALDFIKAKKLDGKFLAFIEEEK